VIDTVPRGIRGFEPPGRPSRLVPGGVFLRVDVHALRVRVARSSPAVQVGAVAGLISSSVQGNTFAGARTRARKIRAKLASSAHSERASSYQNFIEDVFTAQADPAPMNGAFIRVLVSRRRVQTAGNSDALPIAPTAHGGRRAFV